MENNAIDWTPIIVALISSLGGIIGAYLAVQKGNRERDIKDAQREQRQADRLDSIDEKIKRLEKKVDEHNEYGRKFGEVATSLVSMAKDIEYLKRK
jgi:peptidoglycan hydrolase CwlO-like protein